MLSELRVRDLGVIEDVTLSMAEGMVALTGETGAGKTLVVEALSLVLGAKADPGLVRAGATEAIVEARFVRGPTSGDQVDEEVIVTRAVPASGRSKAWINGRMVPVSALSEIGSELVDIHGQRDHHSLLEPANQRRALDVFANTDLSDLEAARQLVDELVASLDALGGDPQQRNREIDMLGHQLDELARAQWVGADEEDRLRDEETLLADLEAHRAAARRALEALEGDGRASGPGALDSLGEALNALSGRTPLADPAARLKGAIAELDDLSHDLRSTLEEWDVDPDRLEVVQARRRLLADLRRKYGETFDAVRRFERDTQTRLEALERARGSAVELEERLEEARGTLAEAEASVRRFRAEAAPRLAAAIEARLVDLAMPGATLEVAIDDRGSGEPVRFLLGANAGEAVLPLAKVASGGELARAMLALRLVASGGPETMVFDEVDAGVGGQAALALARALRDVAGERQVLVVTHLAQVAAVATEQVALAKETKDGRTITTARHLSDAERVREVSRMLSGHPDSETAAAHAEELLEMSRASTTGESALD